MPSRIYLIAIPLRQTKGRKEGRSNELNTDCQKYCTLPRASSHNSAIHTIDVFGVFFLFSASPSAIGAERLEAFGYIKARYRKGRLSALEKAFWDSTYDSPIC